MKNILIVDDEKEIAELLSVYFVSEGFSVLTSETVKGAEEIIKNNNIDIALLDVMLPDGDGFSLCRSIRETYTFPIIMLTAKGEEEDKVKGLNAGADDYVTKPFSVPELMARVKTNLRRSPELISQKEYTFEDIRMDLVEKKVFRNDKYIHLGPTEFRLLKMLMETPGKVFSREFLLKNVWGNNIYVESRTVDVHIRRLRKSLNEYGPDYIRTVRATGYAIDANAHNEEQAE